MGSKKQAAGRCKDSAKAQQLRLLGAALLYCLGMFGLMPLEIETRAAAKASCWSYGSS